MNQQIVSQDKVVYITYSILDKDGNVFEQYDMPVGYVHGANTGLPEKIMQGLEGHAAGDRVEITLSPEEGFGDYDPELTYTDDLQNVPENFRFVGAEAMFKNEEGESRLFRVTRIENDKLTVDGNHPLAGLDVTCVVDIVEVRDATPDEIASGLLDEVTTGGEDRLKMPYGD